MKHDIELPIFKKNGKKVIESHVLNFNIIVFFFQKDYNLIKLIFKKKALQIVSRGFTQSLDILLSFRKTTLRFVSGFYTAIRCHTVAQHCSICAS